MADQNAMPVYEFRPLPEDFDGEIRRYADGQWIPDDGEYDLAFIGLKRYAPICVYFEHPYYSNLACSWLTTHWSATVDKHPNGNAWHYATRNGKKSWGRYLSTAHGNHRNQMVGRLGMAACCKLVGNGCANGRHVQLHADDKHIAAGLVRNAETKEVFQWPTGLKCMYCGAVPPIY